jgi:hypothetical protein
VQYDYSTGKEHQVMGKNIETFTKMEWKLNMDKPEAKIALTFPK